VRETYAYKGKHTSKKQKKKKKKFPKNKKKKKTHKKNFLEKRKKKKNNKKKKKKKKKKLSKTFLKELNPPKRCTWKKANKYKHASRVWIFFLNLGPLLK